MNIGTKYSVGSHSEIYFRWEEQSQDLAKSITVVKWQLVLETDDYGAINSSTKKTYVVKVNGQTYQGTNTIGISNGQLRILTQGTTSIVHDANGNKKFNYSFKQEFGFYSQSLKKQIGFVEGSGSGTLSQIKLYPVITSAPDFAFGDKPTITFNLNGYDYSKVKVCISLTGAKSDVPYRGIEENSSSYTFNLTDEDYKALSVGLNSRSRVIRFYVRTEIADEQYVYSYLTAKYSVNGSLSVKDDEGLWADVKTQGQLVGYNEIYPTQAVDYCCLSNDRLLIALNYKECLICNGIQLKKQVDIKFNGVIIQQFLLSSEVSVSSSLTKSLIVPLEQICIFEKDQNDITCDLEITFYNNIGESVTTSRRIQVIKYNPVTYEAKAWRTSDTTATIQFKVDYTKFKYIKDGKIYDNAVTIKFSLGEDESVVDNGQNTFTVSNLNKSATNITGDLGDTRGSDSFYVTIPPIQRPLNINTQAVAIGDMIDDKENDGRFKCGWPAYFNNGIYCNDIFCESKVLWDGTYYYDSNNSKVFETDEGKLINGVFLNGAQTIILPEAITEQTRGIVFVFSHYENGAYNACWQTHFVPKYLFEIDSTSKEFSIFLIRDTCTAVGLKRITIGSDGKTITGLASNGQNLSESNYVFPISNRYFLLRYIIGV